MKVINPVLPGFNPDPSLVRVEMIIILLHLHLNGFRASVSIIQKIW